MLSLIITGTKYAGHTLAHLPHLKQLTSLHSLYFLNTSLDKIKENYLNNQHNDRPLIKNIDDLDKLYQERMDIYLKMTDKEYIGE